jgi:hypothetical protein
MVKHNVRLHNLQEIRQYVSTTLCQIDLLQPSHFHLSERLLARDDKPCGLYFCLHGPREIRLTAIWETDSNTILFYGCSGERIGRTQLLDGPSLDLSDISSYGNDPPGHKPSPLSISDNWALKQ